MAASNRNLWAGAAVIAALGVGAWTWFASAPAGDATRPASAPEIPLSPPVVVAPAAASSPASSAPLPAANRFKVVGLMINGNDRRVLIAVDGQPARIYRVGETVDGNLVVKSVSEHGAVLGPRDGTETLALEVTQNPVAVAPPAPAPPMTTLPQAPLADGSPQAQEALRNSGARYAPIQPSAQPAASKPALAPAAPVDDGRWRPAGQQ